MVLEEVENTEHFFLQSHCDLFAIQCLEPKVLALLDHE